MAANLSICFNWCQQQEQKLKRVAFQEKELNFANEGNKTQLCREMDYWH